ncbi:MAG: YihY/virulence factor BrkB family protein [Acidobacteriota bacterium]
MTSSAAPERRQGLRLVGVAAWRGLTGLVNGQGMTHAAAIAYYALLSLFPFLLLVLSILGTVTADAEDRDAVVRFVFEYFPRQFEFIARQLDAFRDRSLQLGIGGTLAMAWAALGVFNAVSSAVNHAWRVEHHRSFLRHRLVSFVMLLSAGGIFLAGLLLASAVKVAESTWFFSRFAGASGVAWLQGATPRLGATALLIGCVALVFYFVPNTRVRFRDVWPGAIMTGLLWNGGLELFSWYARDLSRLSLIHGSIATVVVFLLWVYISAVILLFGVEMTASYARLRAPEPS